MENWTASEGKN